MKRALSVTTTLVVLTVLGMTGLAATAGGRAWLHRVDAQVFGERVRDALAHWRTSEDWSKAVVLRPGQDYAWLAVGGAPVRVAHGLGDSGASTGNTLAAARRAYAAGLRLLEVDLVQEAGELRCQHDPGPQEGFVMDGCTFDTLSAVVPEDAWLVLDIKTDFAAVGERIVARAIATGQARRIVFQLYRPEDFELFNRWQTQAPLPGPILTAYLAHRRIDHVAAHAERTGVQALTLPLDRLTALTKKPAGAKVLVHPVRDCVAWLQAQARGADGVYVPSSLRCGTFVAKGAAR